MHEEAGAGAGAGSPQAEATIRPQRDGLQVAALRSMSETRISKFNRLLDEQAGAGCCCRWELNAGASAPWAAGCWVLLSRGHPGLVCRPWPARHKHIAGDQSKFAPPFCLAPPGCLAPQVVDLEALRELAWSGIPAGLRPTCWRLLLGYLPPNRERRTQVRLPGREAAAPPALCCCLDRC